MERVYKSKQWTKPNLFPNYDSHNYLSGNNIIIITNNIYSLINCYYLMHSQKLIIYSAMKTQLNYVYYG